MVLVVRWLSWPSILVVATVDAGAWVARVVVDAGGCAGVRAEMVCGQAGVDTGKQVGVNTDEHAGRNGVRANGRDLPFCCHCPFPSCRLLHLRTSLVLVVVSMSSP